MPEIIKLLGITKSKMNKDKNGESVPHLEITVVIKKIFLKPFHSGFLNIQV